MKATLDFRLFRRAMKRRFDKRRMFLARFGFRLDGPLDPLDSIYWSNPLPEHVFRRWNTWWRQPQYIPAASVLFADSRAWQDILTGLLVHHRSYKVFLPSSFGRRRAALTKKAESSLLLYSLR